MFILGTWYLNLRVLRLRANWKLRALMCWSACLVGNSLYPKDFHFLSFLNKAGGTCIFRQEQEEDSTISVWWEVSTWGADRGDKVASVSGSRAIKPSPRIRVVALTTRYSGNTEGQKPFLQRGRSEICPWKPSPWISVVTLTTCHPGVSARKRLPAFLTLQWCCWWQAGDFALLEDKDASSKA